MKISTIHKILEIDSPIVMGILNITPDSFSDGGKYLKIENAIDHAHRMIRYGAKIIDVGGESTRPGAQSVSRQEELDRVIPIVSELSRRFDVFISVNTSDAEVIRESEKKGAHIVNDVRSLNREDSLHAVANSNLSVCLVHMQGEPIDMQINPFYLNIIEEIKEYFFKQIARCKKVGIERNRLIIDPGFGFGKSLEHNYQLLSSLEEFNCFKLPILVGISRKSMIRNLLGSRIENCNSGNIACSVIAAMKGANIIRAHDARETFEALKIVKKVLLKKDYR